LSYRDLQVWQRSVALIERVYALTRRFPDEEKFALSMQIRRAAVSVPTNIAEGYARGSKADYVRMLWIASGSLAELDTQLIVVQRLGYASTSAHLPCALRPAPCALFGPPRQHHRLHAPRAGQPADAPAVLVDVRNKSVHIQGGGRGHFIVQGLA
jgi:four helix bundle protein